MFSKLDDQQLSFWRVGDEEDDTLPVSWIGLDEWRIL